jgi:hypothetical protein
MQLINDIKNSFFEYLSQTDLSNIPFSGTNVYPYDKHQLISKFFIPTVSIHTHQLEMIKKSFNSRYFIENINKEMINQIENSRHKEILITDSKLSDNIILSQIYENITHQTKYIMIPFYLLNEFFNYSYLRNNISHPYSAEICGVKVYESGYAKNLTFLNGDIFNINCFKDIQINSIEDEYYQKVISMLIPLYLNIKNVEKTFKIVKNDIKYYRAKKLERI